MGQFHFHPDEYLDLMLSEMPGYHRLQEQAAAATGTGAARILELGTGTGETARRVLARHPGATLTGIDASADMLAAADLPGADLRVARLEDELPAGPFDLVVSVLAIHHLDAAGKAGLFRHIAAVLAPGGRFVLGDVVVPDDPADAITPLSPDFDLPSRVDEQLAWLRDAGLEPRVVWSERDLAVLVAASGGAGSARGRDRAID
jgi:tRNA (cmo5U34)-methyltransferase